MKKILVVEDTEVIREEIVDFLSLSGYEVYEAADGLQGISKANEILPDLIVSDILMPFCNGYQMLQELKKNSATENIPFIFLTAKAEKNEIRKGMNLGADDYLSKPLKPTDLLDSIKNKLMKYEILQKRLTNLKLNLSSRLPHEFRTPLNGILGFSEILIEHSHDLSKQDIIEYSRHIYQGGKRLKHLVENYILYSNLLFDSLNNSNLAIDADPIFIKEIVESYTEKFATQLNRLQDVSIQISDFKATIEKNHLTKIVYELITNAIKFSAFGQKIKIVGGIENNFGYLSFRNEGIGMSESDLLEIESFVQFNRNEMEQQGMGLGLSIVKLIMNKYSGKIEITSIKDDFFEARLSFPLKTN